MKESETRTNNDNDLEIEDYVVAPVNGDPNRGLIMDDIEKYNKTGYIALTSEDTMQVFVHKDGEVVFPRRRKIIQKKI